MILNKLQVVDKLLITNDLVIFLKKLKKRLKMPWISRE
jgi:hypothetical protein